MQKERSIILIDGSHDYPWAKVLKDSLNPMDILEIIHEDNAVTLIAQRNYDLVIIDAAAVRDAPLLVSHIRTKCNDARIMIVTASPTWRRAREAFQAGATDYVQKSLDTKETKLTIQAALKKTPPPWSH